MSYYQLYYHIIIGTKGRFSVIPIKHERELYGYLYGIIKNLGGFTYRINGMPDHVHILASLPPKNSVSDMMKTIKQSSSIWLRQNPNFPNWYGWAEGYAIKSYSGDEIERVKNYIIGQKEHHTKITLEDEFKAIMGYSGNDES